jgi:hypothetical protein
MAGTKGGKNRKIGRMTKICGAYTAGNMQQKNHKRAMRRHILMHPDDKQTITLFEKEFGKATDIRVSINGKLTDRPMCGKAAKRAQKKRKAALSATPVLP